jgi:HEAT repeat protein
MDVLQPSVAEQQDVAELPVEHRFPSAGRRLLHLAIVPVGIGFALLISGGGSPAKVWGKAGVSSFQKKFHAAAISEADLDRQNPQNQAEMLLESAVSRSDEATRQIAARVDGWRGKLKWDSQLGDLTTLALNSNDERVRASGIEVQLAAYGLTKSESSVNALVRQANSRNHAQKIWALWALGLLGNRGVETDRVVQVLAAHLKDSGKDTDENKDGNEDGRRWAVEGLALVGTTSTIPPLLEAMHSDPSAAVRQRAASSLAESNMFLPEVRLIAVPQLIHDTDDPALDSQTHALVFQALADITKQRLPNDSAAWRNWYEKAVVSGQ